MSNTICNTSIIFQLSKTTTTHEKENKMSITYTNGKMTCTTSNGQVATRKTDNLYKAAVVGRRKKDGKLLVLFASWTIANAVVALKKAYAPVDVYGNHNYANNKFYGCEDFEVVAATWEELDVIEAQAIKLAA
jgi:hypothetical protein